MRIPCNLCPEKNTLETLSFRHKSTNQRGGNWTEGKKLILANCACNFPGSAENLAIEDERKGKGWEGRETGVRRGKSLFARFRPSGRGRGRRAAASSFLKNVGGPTAHNWLIIHATDMKCSVNKYIFVGACEFNLNSLNRAAAAGGGRGREGGMGVCDQQNESCSK